MSESRNWIVRGDNFKEMWYKLLKSFAATKSVLNVLQDSEFRENAMALYQSDDIEKFSLSKAQLICKQVLKILACCLDNKCKKRIEAQTNLDNFLKGDTCLKESETLALYNILNIADNDVAEVKPIFWEFHKRFSGLGLGTFKDYRAYVNTDFEFEKEIKI